MKDFTLTSEYLNLLDVFCYKLSLSEPDKHFGKDIENADVVPIKITRKEVPEISLSAIMRLDDYFKDTGLKVFDHPYPDVESELDAKYYEWLSVRPNWFADWYTKYQKIRFYRFGQLRPDELTAIAATVQIIRETRTAKGVSRIQEGYLPKSDEKLISESSSSLDDFYSKIKATYQMMMGFGAINSLSLTGDDTTILDYDELLVRRVELGVEDVFRIGVLGLGQPATLVPKDDDKKPSDKQADSMQMAKEYRITLVNRHIILNDLFLLSRPDSFGENEVLFEFLYNNPNKPFSKADIEKEIKQKISKDFSKILENLNFKKDLLKIFFKVSKGKIMFKNPVPVEEVKALGIDFAKISPK